MLYEKIKEEVTLLTCKLIDMFWQFVQSGRM